MNAPAPALSRMLPAHITLARELVANPNRDFTMYAGTWAERTIRYSRQGDVLEVGGEPVARVLLTGIYLRDETACDHLPGRQDWLYLCSADQLEDQLDYDRADVGECEVESLGVAAARWSSQFR